MRIYIDTAPIIYAVEEVDPYYIELDHRLSTPETILVVSDLSRLECRVKPLRLQ